MTQPAGPFTRLNAEVIPASPDPLVGGSYIYTDTQVVAGQTYYYQLEEVETSGGTSVQGVVAVTASGGLSPLLIGAGMGLAVIFILSSSGWAARIIRLMDTYTTTLAIGPLGLSLHTADAELYAAQQRAYHAFALVRGHSNLLRLRFAVTAGAAPDTWPFEFQAGRLHFTADDYTGDLDVARQTRAPRLHRSSAL